MNDRPAMIAASVNGLIVALGPPTLIAILGASHDTAVHPAGYSYFLSAIAQMSVMAVSLSPLAMLAAWRTFVYARRRLDRNEHGWRGVLEAGAAGFLIAVLVLAHGIVTRARDAPPYVLFYGGVALLLGLILGLVLRTAAVTVLHICGDRA